MESTVPEPEKGVAPPPPPPPPPKSVAERFLYDIILRVWLFASTLVSVLVMVTSKQTGLILVPPLQIPQPVDAKFTHSPALVYFVAALSVACLYSIISALASFLAMSSPRHHTKTFLHFIFMDTLILAIVVAAAGSAGGVAYIGLKGNSHTGWAKICNVYDTFCEHIAGSLGLSLLAAILLIFLIMLSSHSLYSLIS
ncbi:Casparian strip membrane protein domain [Dillenia turbinata]|uniref:CASP-like protein n=1 Tax=Dillenia turbinata TaxID=194707 RepID=A0AAN8V823_9MAGN